MIAENPRARVVSADPRVQRLVESLAANLSMQSPFDIADSKVIETAIMTERQRSRVGLDCVRAVRAREVALEVVKPLRQSP
jgi:hypothetical protein